MTTRPDRRPSVAEAATVRVDAGDLSEPIAVDPTTRALDDDVGGERYETRGILGEGGMGVVYLCRDRRIGRQVALKVLHPGEGSSSASRVRFQREARVQGQLEHPGIVPVYDVGARPDGAAFFTMKRVRGSTLTEVLHRIDAGDAEVLEAYAPRRLLAIFSQVVQAVAFGHSRGVIHRDLKPGNIMLGGFGEVYVLDWGLAKIRAEPSEPASSDAPRGSGALDSVPESETLAGEILGTPGYMAPEQIRGDGEAIDARADIYALGAILFEILALSPLHVGVSNAELLASTLHGADARPSARAPERGVPPELDEICVRATELEPARRFSCANELHRLVERYLDGDRDLARRRQLADEHIERARRSLGSATSGPEQSTLTRAEAMQHLGAALSLDPGNEAAVRALTDLLVSAPSRVSPDLRAEYERSRAPAERALRDIAPVAYALWAVGSLSIIVLGIRDLDAFLLPVILQASAALLTWWVARRPLSKPTPTLAVLVLSTAAVAASSAWMGWALLLPCLAILNALGFVLARPGRRAVVLAIAALGVLVPFALETAGITSPSYEIREGALVILPRMTHFPATVTPLMLLVANLILILLPGWLVGRVSLRLRSAEEQLFMHSWNLKHLLPETARGAVGGVDAPSRSATELD